MSDAPSISTPAEQPAFVRYFLERTANLRTPELLSHDLSDVLYRMDGRNGVSVVAVSGRNLDPALLKSIMTFRLAQYVAAGFVDAKQVLELGLQHEAPPANADSEIHIVAVATESAEILSYLSIKGELPCSPNAKMSDPERPLFPVETLFGRGVYDRLNILPALDARNVREIGRFMRSQLRPKSDPECTRATIEVAIAMYAILSAGVPDIRACIGDFEEGVAKRNLDFFQTPMVWMRGVVPFVEEDSYLRAHVEKSTVYPFAILVADLASAQNRVKAIQKALGIGGKEGIGALLALKSTENIAPVSSLLPSGGLPALQATLIPQQGIAMSRRQQWMDAGNRLRNNKAFSTLSPAEASTLGVFLEIVDVSDGQEIVRQGEPSDALYWIEAGEARVEIREDHEPAGHLARTMGVGEFFGEIGLLRNTFRTATVIANTPMRLRRLSRDAYVNYLKHIAGVNDSLEQIASERLQS
jgi:Cyclic nucleotide-binding domain